MATFPGFPKEMTRFLRDLAAHNDRDWFAAHRAQYDAHVMAPAADFVAALGPRLAKISPGLRAEPKLNGSIRRLHRDTRFSKDKTPFNPRLHLIFWDGASAKDSPGLHLVVAGDSLGVGTGLWQFTPPQLAAYRAAVADTAPRNALLKALAIAVDAGHRRDPPLLKKPPKGLPQEGPAAELLRHKGLVVRGDRPIPAALYSPKVIDLALDLFNQIAPVHRWILRHVIGGA